MIQFQNPYDPANFGYNSDRICDMLDKVQIFWEGQKSWKNLPLC